MNYATSTDVIDAAAAVLGAGGATVLTRPNGAGAWVCTVSRGGRSVAGAPRLTPGAARADTVERLRELPSSGGCA